MSSNNLAAWVGIVLGALAVLVVPAAVLVAQARQDVSLLESLYIATPLAIGLGLLALLGARRARLRLARSVLHQSGRLVRTARLAAWAGTWVGVTAGVALAVYGVLRWAQ